MASKEWIEIDLQKHQFEDYYCAFLDILGYKDKLNLFFQGKFNLYGRVQRAMNNAGVEMSPADSPDGIITRIFSDSIILTAPKKDVSIDLMINYTSMLVSFFSYEGLFLRGGISEGKLLESSTNEHSFLASEGLVKAYEMENEARYPMIVVDNSLVSKVSLKTHIVKFENKYILNFARYIINEYAKNESDVIAELEEIKSIKDSVTSENVKEKYEWLINYYLWFIELCNKKKDSFDMSKFSHLYNERNKSFIFTSC